MKLSVTLSLGKNSSMPTAAKASTAISCAKSSLVAGGITVVLKKQRFQ